MSHIQGSDYVGSMVVVEDGLPKKSEYRRFKIKGEQGNDDFAAMEQVLTRRLTAYLAERRQPGRPSGRASSPTRRSCCSSTAARASWRWPCGCSRSSAWPTRSRWPRWPSGSRRSTCPGEADPIRLPRQSEALYLLQRIRDEAHRFAITFHRELRGKRMTTQRPRRHPRPRRGAQEAAGEGARRRDGREGGASLEDLQALPWLPDAVARAVHDKIHGPRRAVAGRRARVDGGRPLGGARRLVAGRASPRAPTPSTRSRSCRWPPSTSPGPRRVLDVGCGEGQVARLAAGGGAAVVVGVDPTCGPGRRRRRGGAAARPTPAPAPRRCRSAPAPSTRSSPASCSSTSATSTPPSPRWPACSRPAAASSSS